jgi:hypothetical protein
MAAWTQDLAEEVPVGEAAKPAAACRGQHEQVLDRAHAGQDLLEDVLRQSRHVPRRPRPRPCSVVVVSLQQPRPSAMPRIAPALAMLR